MSKSWDIYVHEVSEERSPDNSRWLPDWSLVRASRGPVRSVSLRRLTWKTPPLAGRVKGGPAACLGLTCIVYTKWFLTLHGGRDGKTQSDWLKQSGQQLPAKTLAR
ncbi:unnamed protein product [Tetraodon nigroviridis]|uniref:(spotted green pufferfish) hypothetical protein n=1 Tax=Tetraodon nigroviridis TaxID=99883 RepID=Q4S5E3_TETNG|nr:unnamed protein product [Tetraodon nigroviridis]